MFSRRMLINFVLIVLIIVFTYVGNRHDVQTGYQPRQSITGIDSAKIETIEIKTADVSLLLQRHENGWSIEKPIRWPANNVNVERLFDIVNSETQSQLAASEIDLATLGLDFPQAMLRLDDTRVLFGATNNIGARRYTLIGDTVYLLPDLHLPFINQGLPGIVDRRLLPRQIELRSLKLPDFALERDDDNRWRASGDADFTRRQLEQLVANWQGLEASRVKRFNSGAIPRQKIQITLEDGHGIEFFVMSIAPEIVIANPQIELQYHFRADLYYQLISLRSNENSV